MMEQTSRGEIDLRKMEEVIKSDPALCYRLLRFLNSYAFCLRTTITSIRHALTLLGEHQVRRWIAVACVSVAADNSSQCLLSSALMRARFGEALAPKTGCRSYDLFLLGLFSMMDTILGIPLEQLLDKVKVPPDTEAALLGKPNRLRDILDLIIAYDRANWEKTKALCAKVHVDQSDLADDYIRSLQWVDQILGMTMEPPQAVADIPPQTQTSVGNGLRPV
jgi:EAL and modified HD-GYP domain-containing signal transduction protein